MVRGMTLDDLLAKEEIKDVIKRLARGTDRLDEELMVSCYHPDGFDDHNAFRGSATDFAAWVCEMLPHFQATMHSIADPYIELEPRRVVPTSANPDPMQFTVLIVEDGNLPQPMANRT
jgi:hypothetical protein